MRYLNRRHAVFAASFVLALSLAACGNNSDTNTTAADNTATTEDAATPNAERHDDAGQAESAGKAVDNQMDEAAIRKQIIDHTVTGSMSTGGAYGEYYAPNGKVLAADYTGSWTIEDDMLCLDYGDGVDCYAAAMDGLDVIWYLDGKKVGTGKLQAGNPNDFSGQADS